MQYLASLMKAATYPHKRTCTHKHDYMFQEVKYTLVVTGTVLVKMEMATTTHPSTSHPIGVFRLYVLFTAFDTVDLEILGSFCLW